MNSKTIEIIAKTDDYIVVNKPSGMESEHEVIQQLGEGTYYCVHRLDTPTSGLVVYARSKAFANELSRQIQSHQFKKTYKAVVSDRAEAKGEMCDYLYRDRRLGKAFVVKRQRKGVKEARLTYERLAVSEEPLMSLVLIQLDTGRFHQIRCQFASRQMSIVGDGKYGSRIKADHIALCSCALSFNDHNQRVYFSIEPPDEYPWTLFDD